MTTPRFLSARLAPVLALGCALLAFSPAPSAHAQKKMPPPVALTPALLDKVEKVAKLLAADPAANEELKSVNHEDELDPTLADTDDAMVKKYPKLGAVYKAADLKPHEFVGALITMLVANRATDGGADKELEVSPANVEFVKANRDRVKAVLKAIIGEEP